MSDDVALLEEEQVEAPSDEAPSSAEGEASEVLLLTMWVSEAAKQRFLDAHRFRITDDRAVAEQAGMVVVSTRFPRGTPFSIIEGLRSSTDAPIVVLCHPGGEEKALQMMRVGANAIVAEGREKAVLRLLMDLPGDESLVDSYAGAVDRQWLAGGANLRRDPITGLLTASSLELRLAELEQMAEIPRLTMVRLVDFDAIERATGPTGFDVLRRRLGAAFSDLAGMYHGEIYSLDRSNAVIIGRNQTPEAASNMARSLLSVAAGFVPGGSVLKVAVGQAGPEVSTDVSSLRSLASKALDSASQREGSAVVDAEDLTQSLAGQTELDAALHLLAYVDNLEGGAGAHSQRVTDYANELAAELAQEFELDSRALDRIRLAAKLHGIGKLTASGELPARDSDEYQQHVVRGHEYAVVAAGSEVAEAVRHHHERWDGEGYPDGLAEDAIPVGARIVAVADALDFWMNPTDGEATALDDAIQRLEDGANTEFDPAVARAAVRLLKQGG